MKQLFAILCSLIVMLVLVPTNALAAGGGNIDQGGGNVGRGTSQNKWFPGDDGVRITVVDAKTGIPVSSPVGLPNRPQPAIIYCFGTNNKIEYRNGTPLAMESTVPYQCRQPAYSMPPIVNDKSRPTSVKIIKRYFCSEYAYQIVAEATGVSYEKMLSGEYKVLLEPIAYVTFNDMNYCFTVTETALYDQLSDGALGQRLPTVAFQNLPLAMFLEYDDIGFFAWIGPRTGVQSSTDIINYLGLGLVRFDEGPEEPGNPGEDIETPDMEYQVNTDVITAITLRSNRGLAPDNPASVAFHIMDRTYRIQDTVIPAGDSQVIWVRWRTPDTP